MPKKAVLKLNWLKNGDYQINNDLHAIIYQSKSGSSANFSQLDILAHVDPFASSFSYLVIKKFGSLMAGEPKQMSQIKQLIRLYQGGNGIKQYPNSRGTVDISRSLP
ncbi:hypothetical protein EDF67_1011077 [Sphingobacterium sp. JUb78]|nr:hypothetical protein [Sphingobacterium kitahiroshimense]TCR14970.1 hypothetical protein EDF67_1011077 [Sphingobacterium sp. JUb78]